MKIIEGIANIYHEISGEYQFDYSVFVYPNSYAAQAAVERQSLKEKMRQLGGRPVQVRIEIPELPQEVNPNADGSGILKEES